jgi:hypothetical protein
MLAFEMNKMLLTNVSAVQSVGGFCLNRSDSGFSGLYGLPDTSG